MLYARIESFTRTTEGAVYNSEIREMRCPIGDALEACKKIASDYMNVWGVEAYDSETAETHVFIGTHSGVEETVFLGASYWYDEYCEKLTDCNAREAVRQLLEAKSLLVI